MKINSSHIRRKDSKKTKDERRKTKDFFVFRILQEAGYALDRSRNSENCLIGGVVLRLLDRAVFFLLNPIKPTAGFSYNRQSLSPIKELCSVSYQAPQEQLSLLLGMIFNTRKGEGNRFRVPGMIFNTHEGGGEQKKRPEGRSKLLKIIAYR